jgi:tRNA-dihydrouridine synthase B
VRKEPALHEHHALYGEWTGVRSARKHIGWAVNGLPDGEAFRQRINAIDDAAEQGRALNDYFERLASRHERLPDRLAGAEGNRAANDDNDNNEQQQAA